MNRHVRTREDAGIFVELESPRFVTGGPLLIGGLREGYDAGSRDAIPELWQRVMPHIGKIRGQVGRAAWGICFNTFVDADSFDYLAGVQVTDVSSLPGEWSYVSIPGQKYAVFPHRAHVSEIRNTVDAIFNRWMPETGHELNNTAADKPAFLERYSEEFDPQAGTGGMEIWVPIRT